MVNAPCAGPFFPSFRTDPVSYNWCLSCTLQPCFVHVSKCVNFLLAEVFTFLKPFELWKSVNFWGKYGQIYQTTQFGRVKVVVYYGCTWLEMKSTQVNALRCSSPWPRALTRQWPKKILSAAKIKSITGIWVHRIHIWDIKVVIALRPCLCYNIGGNLPQIAEGWCHTPIEQ